ncbi:MAG: asparagine synthase (glutamine-hydrolyzing) [Betaproteobacteria bacterium]|nr:asparagine synthase (glutamine-hydrolyzing) [Betaproteobacteria bacterium]
MCGFAGFVGPGCERDAGLAVLGRMASAIVRRGPDEEGSWLGSDGTVGLAHRRLAVVGLGPQGRQPMASASGRFVIAYNGEIYNHPALRRELEGLGSQFAGSSDTEVLLAAVEAWGVEATLGRCVGMFAFALWDRAERSLYLCRDRFGEKPLYCGWQGDSFLFASDLAALRVHPGFVGGIDRAALALLVARNCIPAPLSIHPGIGKLEPGTIMRLAWRDGDWRESRKTYWSAVVAATDAAARPFCGSEQDAVAIAHDLLRESVRSQLVADVPLGAFLSGGVDSSAIVALMQSVSPIPVRSFTIGFADPAYDESAHAARVATHLGTAHRERRLDATDALALIPQLPSFYSEPFADASQLPTLMVSRVAREQVTVALSGDGGDEMFGGYNRYVWTEPFLRRLERLPGWLRRALGQALTAASPATLDATLGKLAGARQPGQKLHKLATLMAASNARDAHRRLAGFWLDGTPVTGAEKAEIPCPPASDPWAGGRGLTESMMLADTVTYLPDDILVKVDRAAMSVSLETRAPFLDHRLFEFLWSLPLSFRVRRGVSKRILREILYRYVPRELVERPKAGFSLPIHDWLRGPLRDWAETLLDAGRLRREGYFDSALVRRAWEEHLAGRRYRQYDLWSILMFQAWQETWQC